MRRSGLGQILFKVRSSIHRACKRRLPGRSICDKRLILQQAMLHVAIERHFHDA